jgi:hypothetical protein
MLSKRFTTMLLAGAASAGLASSAHAALVIGIRAIGTYDNTDFANPQPLSGPNTPTHIPAPTPGMVISMEVYAQVTQTGDIGAMGYPVMSSTAGRVVSTSDPLTIQANVFGSFLDESMNNSGSGPGTIQNLDINNPGNGLGDDDNDLDLGKTTLPADVADPDGWVLYRADGSGGVVGPLQRTNNTTAYGVNPITGAVNEPTSIPGGFEYFLGEVDFVVPSGLGTGTVVEWQFRPGSGNATWFENSNRSLTTSKSGTTISYSGGNAGTQFGTGTAVTLGILGTIPEPSSLGLAALAGLGLLSRRNKKD